MAVWFSMGPACCWTIDRGTVDLNALESPTLALAERAALARAQGLPTLSVSTPSFPYTPLQVEQASIDLRLGTGAGDADCRALLARTLFRRWNAGADQLVLTSGAKASLLCLFATLRTADSKLVCLTPAWPTYWGVAHVLGLPVTLIARSLQQDWSIDLKRVDAVLKQGDIVVLSNPCNPTGRVYSRAEMDALDDVCQRASAWLVLDESFSETTEPGDAYFESGAPPSESTIVVNSVFKNYLAQGWRLGAVLASPRVLEAYARMQTALVSPPASVLQTLAASVIRPPEALAVLSPRRNQVHARLLRAGFDCHLATGGFYLFPRRQGLDRVLPALETSHRAFVLDGTAFGLDDPHAFRLCLLQSEEALASILQMLESL